MNASSLFSARRFLVVVAFALVAGLTTGQVKSSHLQQQSSPIMANAASVLTNTLALDATECYPGSGWKWTTGPSQPEIADRVQQALNEIGIQALVEARSYGETDSCGTFRLFGLDFIISLKDGSQTASTDQQQLVDTFYPVLRQFGKPNLGNVKLVFPQGKVITLRNPEIARPLSVSATPSSDVFTRKVFVIAYDPILSNTQNLSTYLHWNAHATLTQGTVDFFKQVSNNGVNYTVVYTTVVTDGWPELVDGFRYTETEYLAVLNHTSSPHVPDGVNYNKIVNSPQFDICGKLNRGEIDEVWIYNGPYFGFWESTLAGPGAYWYNSPPVPGPYSCNKLVPIMGPSPERGLAEATENFGHRTESTMTKVYGSWQQNRTAHNWDRFALVKAQSPNYSYSGCGSIHYPPNGTSDYDYGNSSTVMSNCGDFVHYPKLGDPSVVSQPVTCGAWGCAHLDYFAYWFGHFPSNADCGPDHIANDWWNYFASPALALTPSELCTQNHIYLPIVLQNYPVSVKYWQLQVSGTAQFLKDLSFTDDQNGWVVGDGGIILHTSSSGNTWEIQSSGTVATLEGIHCIAGGQCWAVGDSGTILKTTDNGLHWTLLTGGTTQDLDNVYFVDTNTGWVVGNNGTILHTLDGGTHWMPQTSNTTFWLWGIHFLNQNTGWASGGNGSGVILRTANGGTTWTPTNTSNEVADLFFIDNLNGWAVTNAAANILLSSNGGISWNITTPSSPAGWLTSIHFISIYEGWATGSNGTILHTVDGGMHWSTEPSNVSGILQSVYFPSPNVGWVVGESGVILRHGP